MPGNNGTITLGCEDGTCTYGVNMDCLWVVESGAGDVVTVSWEWIDVEDGGNCGFDYVELVAVPTAGVPRPLQTACGSQVPDDVTLEAGEDLRVQFHSDIYTQLSGFGLRFAVVPAGTPDDGSGNGGSDTGSDDGTCLRVCMCVDAGGGGRAVGPLTIRVRPCSYALTPTTAHHRDHRVVNTVAAPQPPAAPTSRWSSAT